MSTATPRWLTAYTTTSGLPDPRVAGTTARPRHCRCGRVVIAGYDAPALAELVTCDPHPLTPNLEAAAVILGVPTYRLWGAPGRYELTARHIPEIAPECVRTSANKAVVLAAHRCEYPPLSTADIPASTGTPTPAQPPF